MADKPDIFQYIRRTWPVLTRSHADLAAAAVDPKSSPLADGRWPVYVPASTDPVEIEAELRSGPAPPDFSKIELRRLPANGVRVEPPGLLYLPRPYVVPGGRFNEMYGWDSYFIQMGLLRDGHFQLAKDLADNFLYQVRQYGKILNANRTYYLTRSQPPFLTAMLLAVYQRSEDRAWLEQALPAVDQYYCYWTAEPHLTTESGLSRYFDSGAGPAPEVVASEHDAGGHNDYDLIREFFRAHPVLESYDIRRFYDARRDVLTGEFYKGDRAMRESGFDPSNRFGPFGADIAHYNPVCLNSLLYLMETQTAEIVKLLGRDADEADLWTNRASNRAAKINALSWDEDEGLYFDYNFVDRQTRRYPFLTTFYPLWAGIATKEQAARVISNLALFERAGGLQTSTHESGDQWDAPFGWAPLQWIAVQGMRRYGFAAEADRVFKNFLAMVRREYERNGTIEEKYDVVRAQADVSKDIRFGYFSNEAGFGWTNAVFTALSDELAGTNAHNGRWLARDPAR